MQLRPAPPKCLVCKAMKPVPAYSLIHTISARKGVLTGDPRQRRKERSIEGCNLHDIRTCNTASGLDPFESFRVVQGRELGQRVDGSRYARIDPDRRGEAPATMNYAVRDCSRRRSQFRKKARQHLVRHEAFAAQVVLCNRCDIVRAADFERGEFYGRA